MSKLTRRDLMKLAALSSPFLMGHTPLLFAPKNFQVFWIHLEGAPVRLGWDNWLDPRKIFKTKSFIPQDKVLKTSNSEVSLPSFWKDHPDFSSLLEHWLVIRGLETKGPHLKESRREWFTAENGKPLLDELDELFSDQWKRPSRFYPQGKRTELLNKKYVQREGETFISTTQGSAVKGLEEIFKLWSFEVRKPSVQKSPLHVCVFRGLDDQNGPLFEEVNKWNKESSEFHELFFRELTREIHQFVTGLKTQKLFDQSVIMITSDRGRAPTEDSPFPSLDTTWQGLNVSLISGAIQGPITLGDIYKEHPKYKESYPMTWGAGVRNLGPHHVHQLISDLCLAQVRSTQYNHAQENPWLVPRRLQGLFIKGHRGRVL